MGVFGVFTCVLGVYMVYIYMCMYTVCVWRVYIGVNMAMQVYTVCVYGGYT